MNFAIAAPSTPKEIKSEETVYSLARYNTWKYYKITASEQINTLSVLLYNLDKDVDLYVRKGAIPSGHEDNNGIYDCGSAKSGTQSESCILSNPANTTTDWYIGVYGFKQSTFSLTATLLNNNDDVEITPISFNSKTSPIDIPEKSWQFFSVDVPTDQAAAIFKAHGIYPANFRDLQLFIQQDTRPTSIDQKPEQGQYLCASYSPSQMQVCSIANAAGKHLVIGVYNTSKKTQRHMLNVYGATENQSLPLSIDSKINVKALKKGDWHSYIFNSIKTGIGWSNVAYTTALTNMNADADLYYYKHDKSSPPINERSDFICESNRGSNSTESCIFYANQNPYTIITGVYGYEDTDYTLQTELSIHEVPELTPNIKFPPYRLAYRSYRMYHLKNPDVTTFKLTDLTDDADIYVYDGRYFPQSSAIDQQASLLCSSTNSGTEDDSCTTGPGYKWIVVHAYHNASYRIEAVVETPE